MYRELLRVATTPDTFADVTNAVGATIKKSNVHDGLCNVFLKATTAGLLINEHNRMLMADFLAMFDKAAPKEKIYHHPENGHAHLRAAMVHQHLSIPISNGALFLDPSQSILLFEFDVKDRDREIVITVLGD